MTQERLRISLARVIRRLLSTHPALRGPFKINARLKNG